MKDRERFGGKKGGGAENLMISNVIKSHRV